MSGSEGYLEIPFAWKPPAKQATVRIIRQTPPLTDQKRNSPATPVAPPEPELVTVDNDNSLYGQEADDFAAAVLDGSKAVVSAEDSINNMKVVDRISRLIREPA